MKKLLAFVGATVLGWVGWWLGAFVGTMTAFIVSMIGTGVGIYLGARITRSIWSSRFPVRVGGRY